MDIKLSADDPNSIRVIICFPQLQAILLSMYIIETLLQKSILGAVAVFDYPGRLPLLGSWKETYPPIYLLYKEKIRKPRTPCPLPTLACVRRMILHRAECIES